MGKNYKKIYGYDAKGTPLRTQKDVIKNYFLTNPGPNNAISHRHCETEFGFTRLSAIVFNIEKEDGITVMREEREVPTRYGAITSRPTFYWVDKEEVEAYLKERES